MKTARKKQLEGRALNTTLYCYVEKENAAYAKNEGKILFGSFSAYVNSLIAKDRGVTPKLGYWKAEGESKKLRLSQTQKHAIKLAKRRKKRAAKKLQAELLKQSNLGEQSQLNRPTDAILVSRAGSKKPLKPVLEESSQNSLLKKDSTQKPSDLLPTPNEPVRNESIESNFNDESNYEVYE